MRRFSICTVSLPGLYERTLHTAANLKFFYPRDAMLARVLAMVLCLSVSVTSRNRCSIETAEPTRLAFGVGASLDLSYNAF